MAADPFVQSGRRFREHNRPMGVIQRRKQREPVVGQRSAFGNKQLTSLSDLRPEADEQAIVVATGDFEDREAP
jgi:hypothetical protein